LVLNRRRLISDGASIESVRAENGLLTIKNGSVVTGGMSASQGSLVDISDSTVNGAAGIGFVLSDRSSAVVTNSSISGSGTGLSVAE
jgi:hypothetical protein